MSSVYSRHPDLRLTSLAGEGVALHMGERKYFTVNATGLTILSAMETPASFEQLVGAITAEFDVDQATAEQATREFLDQCLAAKVITETGE